MIRATTDVTLERFLAFPQNLFFGLALLVRVPLAFLRFTKILLMVVLTIYFFTL
jgi:hypothetical protein